MNIRTPLFLLSLALTAPINAEDKTAEPALDWLAGHWCGGDATRQTEELWLPPANGELLGMSRIVADGRMVEFEFLRIARHAGALAYLAQPRGRAPTVFRWTGGGADWVRFENPEHDFPTRIEYRRSGDQLDAEIVGPDGAGGEQRIGFGYRRCGQA